MTTDIEPAAVLLAHDAPAPDAEVADLIVAYLEQLGVEYVFGVPGGAIEPLYNALARSSRRGGPRLILARHEAGAAFMADGYARETGRIGVCCATSGPGATNLITGVACAYDNGIPMLAITGQPALPSFGKRAQQESACAGVNTIGIFRNCTCYDSLISHTGQVEQKLVQALMRACRQPRGPAHLTVPLDIMRSPIASAVPTYDLRPKLRPRTLVDENAFGKLCELLAAATKPVLLIGAWCGEAVPSILQFAKRRGVPFITTPDGKGLVNPRHKLYHGVFGFAGHRTADDLLRDPDVDLILAVGTSMREWTSGGWCDTVLSSRLVHIDAAEEHMFRSPMARLHVRGRLHTIFDRLLDRLGDAAPMSEQMMASGDPEAFVADAASMRSDAAPITPQRLMRELGRRFPPATRFLADAGNSVAWATHYLNPNDKRIDERRGAGHSGRRNDGRRRNNGGWLRMAIDFSPMGWAIGGAVGTAAGNRQVPVVCITGDGCMLMNGQELSVAVAEHLTVIFVVLNDAAFGMVKDGRRPAGAERIGFQLPPTDFAAIAIAMGADACIVASPQDFAALDVDAICARKGPTLVDVRIDPGEVPPIGLGMQGLEVAS